MKQLVSERKQVAGVPVWEKVTISPEILPAAPDTLAVHREIVSVLTTREEGSHDTEVFVNAATEEGVTKEMSATRVIRTRTILVGMIALWLFIIRVFEGHFD
jgi:hypothetical protein